MARTMPTAQQNSPPILVPTDLSTASFGVLGLAARVARRFHSPVLLYNVPPLPPFVGEASAALPDLSQIVREAAVKSLYETSQRPELAGLQVETIVGDDGAPAPQIVGLARGRSAALIVMATHGRRGPARLLLGSVAEEVVRTASCPVMTVRHGDVGCGKESELLVPIDFSESSVYALEAASRLARVMNYGLCLFHVIEPPALREIANVSRADSQRRAEERLEELATDTGIERCRSITAYGGSSERILNQIELIRPAAVVMGSHGRRGLGRIVLGSVAESVVRTAVCPTVVIKHGESIERWPGSA